MNQKVRIENFTIKIKKKYEILIYQEAFNY